MRLLFACLVFALPFFTLNPSVFAHSDHDLGQVSGGQINEALGKTTPIRFLPSSPFYIFIIAKENFSRFFQPAAKDRAQFDEILAEKRIKEVYLLLKNKNLEKSSKILDKYSVRLEKTIVQINKARSQSQDVARVLDRISEGIIWQEILLASIQQEGKGNESFKESYNNALSKFEWYVDEIDKLKPGLKGRLNYIIFEDELDNKEFEIESSSSGSAAPIVTPRANPHKIIY